MGAFSNNTTRLLLAVFWAFVLSSGTLAQPSFNSPPLNCASYRCRAKGHHPVPKNMRFKSKGCNTGGISMFNPGQAQSTGLLQKCCDLRNACFDTCGISFSYCVKQFQKCTVNACVTQVDPERKKSCETSANLYRMTVSLGGCSKFDQTQQENCDCVVGEARLRKKRLKTLKSFYKKHNKKHAENKEKLDKLVEKHGTNTGKFAKLTYKLVSKYYPKSIKIEKDPQHAMYEAMMNDVKKGRAADDYRDEADDKRSAAEIEPEEDDNEPETTTAYVEDDGDSEVIDLDA